MEYFCDDLLTVVKDFNELHDVLHVETNQIFDTVVEDDFIHMGIC